MTVGDLIKELEKHSPTMTVVTDLHSEYSEVLSVRSIVGFDNGGYVSRVYDRENSFRSHGYVYVGTSEAPK